MKKEVGMLLQKRADTSAVGIRPELIIHLK